MDYKVVYKKSVGRDLSKLSKADVRRVLERIERILAAAPEKNPPPKGRFAGLRKFRSGDWRVIYALVGEHLVVLKIGHRRDVYRKDV